MGMIRKIFLSLGLLALTACTPASPYTKGKSPADVPSHINTVYLEKVYISSGDTETNGDPKEATDPLQESRDMLVIAKPTIVSQLTNFGYKIVENPKATADIGMKCGVRYLQLWPLANNNMTTWCGIYDIADMAGAPLFRMATTQERQSGLVTIMVEASRSDMAAQEARDVVIKVVDEIRKGTK